MAAVPRARHDRGMTQNPADTTPSPIAPRTGLDAMFDWLRGLGVPRATDERWFGGVCAGVARRLGVDPIVIRAAAILLALFGGFGVTVYLVAWLLLPDRGGRILAEAALRDGDAWAVVLGIIVLISLFGGIAVGHNGPWWFAWWLVPVAIIAWLALRARDRGAAPGSPPPPMRYGPATPAAYGPAAPAGYGPTTPAAYGPAAPAAYGPAGQVPGPGGPVPQQPAPGTYAAPPRATATVVAPPPPARPRRRPAGGGMALVAIGLVLAGYGLGFVLDGPTHFPGSPELLGLAIALGAVSLLAIGLGVTGRRGGMASVLVVIVGLSTWAATLSPLSISTTAGVGDRTWVPVATGSTTYQLGLGDATLDLSSLPGVVASGGSASVAAHVGVGNLRIIVPRGMTAHVDYSVGYGSVHGTGSSGTALLTGANRGSSENGSLTVGSGATTVDVSAKVGVGDITIEEE